MMGQLCFDMVSVMKTLLCDAEGCTFRTLEDATMMEAVQHLGHHVAAKHPAPAGGGVVRKPAKLEAGNWPKDTELNDAKQAEEEMVETFAARIQRIAAV